MDSAPSLSPAADSSTVSRTPSQVTSNAAIKLKSSSLLMTCRVLHSLDGSMAEARALLDNASSASFVSEQLVQSLCLPRAHQNIQVSGIADYHQTHRFNLLLVSRYQ